MQFRHKLALITALFCCTFAGAQTTTTFTGTIKDLTNTAVTSGNVTFTLQPGADTTISGVARFTPLTVTCAINGSGLLKANDLTNPCVVTSNTALTPAGTAYKVTLCPLFACTSTFFTYAIGGTVDITTVIPTPTTSPFYGTYVDVSTNQTIAGNKTFLGTITGSGDNPFIWGGSFQAKKIEGHCYVDGTAYATLAAAYNDTNCAVVYLAPNYTEAQAGGLFHFNRAKVKLICLGGTCNITNTAGWIIDAATNHVYIGSDIPYGMDGNGTAASFSFSGYTGSGVAFQVGAGTATTNYVALVNVHVDLLSAAAGAVALKWFRTQQFFTDNFSCLLAADSQTCVTTDGTGDFTGIGEMRNSFVGTGVGGTNAIGIQSGILTTHFKVSGGNVSVIQAGTSKCFDANGGELWLVLPNCNTAITAVTVEKNGTSIGRVSGLLRIDSGVTNGANFGANTIGSNILCVDCNASTPVTDSGGAASFNSFQTPDSFWFNSTHWSLQAATGHFTVRDVINSKGPIDIVPGGNMFLGNATVNVQLDTGDRFTLAESSDGSCAAGSELFQASSVRHAFSWCNNGGSIFAGTQTIGTGNVTTAGTLIAAGTCQAQTNITVTGSLTTDSVTANIGAALPATWQTGITFRADVTAGGTVTVNLCNPTAAGITPAATQVNVRVNR